MDSMGLAHSHACIRARREARSHGLSSVGLPSRLADFKEVAASEQDQQVGTNM